MRIFGKLGGFSRIFDLFLFLKYRLQKFLPIYIIAWRVRKSVQIWLNRTVSVYLNKVLSEGHLFQVERDGIVLISK